MSSLNALHQILEQFPNNRAQSARLLKQLDDTDLNEMRLHLSINIRDMDMFRNRTFYYNHATNLLEWANREIFMRKNFRYASSVSQFLSFDLPEHTQQHILNFVGGGIQRPHGYQLDYDMLNSYYNQRLRREQRIDTMDQAIPQITDLSQNPDIFNEIQSYLPRL